MPKYAAATPCNDWWRMYKWFNTFYLQLGFWLSQIKTLDNKNMKRDPNSNRVRKEKPFLETIIIVSKSS